MLEAVAAACATCWKADHPRPPASALYLVDDWKWDANCQKGTQDRAVQRAQAAGWQGTGAELLIAAHREMYARTGDDIHLTWMLNHIT